MTYKNPRKRLISLFRTPKNRTVHEVRVMQQPGKSAKDFCEDIRKFRREFNVHINDCWFEVADDGELIGAKFIVRSENLKKAERLASKLMSFRIIRIRQNIIRFLTSRPFYYAC